jgi:hypothetical protein
MHDSPEDAPRDDASAPTALVTPTHKEIYEARRADYNKLVSNARLRALILEKVDFKIQPEALSADKALLKRHLSPKTKIMSTGLDDGTCVANIIWEVGFKLKNKNVVKCSASYIISYEGVRDCSTDGVTVFLENVGKVATYAYFRALYSQLDWSATLGSEPLPVIQFLPNFRKSSETTVTPPSK